MMQPASNGTYTATVEVAQIDFHAANYNGHPADQIAALQDAISRYGYVRRAVVQEGPDGRFTCVAGEGAITAIKLEGYEEIEVTVIPSDWPEGRVLGYLVDDNETARLSERNEARLGDILERLGTMGEEPPEALSGQEIEAIEQALAQERGDDAGPPSAPEEELIDVSEQLMAKWGTALGQLWRIGDHLLLIGDSTDPGSWSRLISAAGVSHFDGMITSPPYAKQREADYNSVAADQYVQWWLDCIDPLVNKHLRPDGSLFVNIKAHTEDGRRHTYDKALVLALEEAGWLYFEEFAWVKPGRPGEYINRFKNGWEPVHHFTRTIDLLANIEEVFEEREGGVAVDASWTPLAKAQGRSAPRRQHTVDKARPSNVLKINHDRPGIVGAGHPARFPVALPAFCIRAYSPPGASWLDFFSGTGSSLLACQRHGRHGYGIELEPRFGAVALERFLIDFEIEGELIT